MHRVCTAMPTGRSAARTSRGSHFRGEPGRTLRPSPHPAGELPQLNRGLAACDKPKRCERGVDTC